ncbi:hypothetical protein J9097_004296 [Vibrio vulnificus]|nr:hypothetical protein [Vibrio vulnificus]
MSKIDKSDLADEYLEQAIECFLDQKRYACALHLAGAAQDINESLIKSKRQQDFPRLMVDFLEKSMSKTSSVEFDKKEFLKQERIARNAVKHMDGSKDRYIDMNLESEAFSALNNALMNSLFLKKKETENIKRFKDYFKINAFKYI